MVDGAGAIDKERDGFVDSQRRQTKNAFAAYFERLAAGREDAESRAAGQKHSGGGSGPVDDVLAVVEHQRKVLIAKMRDQHVL